MRYWLIDDAGYLENTIEWDGSSSLSLPAGWTTQIAGGTPPPLSPAQLKTYQQNKLAAIAQRTTSLCAAGFTFSLAVGGPATFTLSQEARANWLGLFLGATSGALTFPFSGIATVSGPSATFSSAAEVSAWYQGGLARIVQVETGGNLLADAVNRATTQSQVDAVIDNRV